MDKIKLKNLDQLKGNFQLLVDNQVIEEYSKEMQITIGNNEYLPGFDDYLLGRKVKEDFEVKFFFPKNYELESFAGKKAIVKIDNIQVSSQELNNSKELEELKNKVLMLESKLSLKELEIHQMSEAFKQKANEFASKTQEKIDQISNEYKEKLDNEKANIKKYALQSFAEGFAIPFNNFLSAINVGQNSSNQEVQNYCFGFNIVSKQFETLLNENGIELINPELNSEFNPETQEVVDFKEDQDSNNKILKIVRLGFSLNGRVISPASVVLSKKI